MNLLPRLHARIERRLLINYRLDAGVAADLLPAGLRPQLVDGSAVAGICLIRLSGLRPAWSPLAVPWRAENAAHRIAVRWDDASGPRTGVFIPARHTASALAVAAGGRVFPGTHARARFEGVERHDRFRVSLDAADVRVRAEVVAVPEFRSTLFESLDDASAFFRRGDVGWSPTRDPGRLEGLRLSTDRWSVQAGDAVRVESSFFDALPAGSAEPDCALIMTDVPVVWHAAGSRRVAARSQPVLAV